MRNLAWEKNIKLELQLSLINTFSFSIWYIKIRSSFFQTSTGFFIFEMIAMLKLLNNLTENVPGVSAEVKLPAGIMKLY